MKARPAQRFLGILVLATLVLAAGISVHVVDATGTDDPQPAPGLTDYNPIAAGALLVVGRDRLRLCVDTLDERLSVGEAASLLRGVLSRAEGDPRWRPEFDEALVETGCPLPPAVLAIEEPALQRFYCRPAVGPFLVYAYTADVAAFAKPFPEEDVQRSFPVPGIRRATQEVIRGEEGECSYQVAEAWYLTPEDLHNEDLLLEYVFSMFPIASVPE